MTELTRMPLVFCLPFSLLSSLQLRQRQKVGLVAIFSLGLITICISLARFTAYIASDWDIDDENGSMYQCPSFALVYFLILSRQASPFHTLTEHTDAWCTAEMSTAIIVVSLPGLKRLLTRDGSPSNSQYNRNAHGYVQTDSGKVKVTPRNTTRSSSCHIQGGQWNDGMELVFLGSEQTGGKAKGADNVVTVTRDTSVSRV